MKNAATARPVILRITKVLSASALVSDCSWNLRGVAQNCWGATIFDIFGSWNFVHIRKLLQNGLQGRIFGPWHRWEQMMFQLILPRTIPGHWSPVANRLRPVTALQYSLRPSCIPPQSHLLKGFLTEASRVLRNWLSTKSGLKFSNLEG